MRPRLRRSRGLGPARPGGNFRFPPNDRRVLTLCLWRHSIMSTPDLEAILRQDDWLRRMARSLVRDPHAAEDLAQEAWLADLQGGDAARDKRSWLSGVLFRAGSQAFRTRRNQRERAESAYHLREDAAPSTDDVVGDRQMRSLVAEELLALPEPERTALHLVYVADLSVTEASRRMGIAKSTASRRVDRGLDLLRQRIDKAYGGDRQAWCVALLPWASLRSGSGAAASASSSGALGVGVWAAAALVVASIAGLGWKVWSSGPSSSSTSTGGSSTLAVGAAPATPENEPALTGLAPTPARSVVTSNSTTRQGDPLPTARIRARFVSVNGQPVTGVTWRLFGRPRNSEAVQEFGLPELWEDPVGEVDGEGFLDASIAVPQAYAFTLRVEGPEYATTNWRFAGLKPDEDKQLGTVELPPGLTLVGRIATPSGDPLSDRVWTVRAASQGSSPLLERDETRIRVDVPIGQSTFELTGLPPGTVSVKLSAEGGRAEEPHVLSLTSSVTTPHTFTVDPSSLVSSTLGLFLDMGVAARMDPLDPASILAIAADGRQLEVLGRGPRNWAFDVHEPTPLPISVSLLDQRFEAWDVEIDDLTTSRQIALVGTSSLELDVKNAAGEPIGLYSVELAPPADANIRWQPNLFLHNGREPLTEGLIERVVPGSYTLIVRGDEGTAEIPIDGLLPRERRVVAVLLQSAPMVEGTVRNPDGEPVRGVAVHLVRPAEVDDSEASRLVLSEGQGFGGEEWRFSVARATTDLDGRFAIEPPADEDYYVVVSDPGKTYSISGRLTPAQQREALDLTLPSGATLEGTLALADHLPKKGWAVVLSTMDPRIGDFSLGRPPELDRDGQFRMEGLMAGETSVYLMRGSRRSMSGDGRPREGFLVGTVTLEEGATTEATFAFVDGVPTAVTADLVHPTALDGKITVTFYRTDGEARGRKGRLQGPEDRLGSCLLSPGTYVPSVSQKEWAVLNAPPLTLSAVESHTVPVQVALTERRIRVLGEGVPLPNASLRLRSSGGRSARFKTDAEGWVTLRLDDGPLVGNHRMLEGELVWPPATDELRLEPSM